MLCIGDAAHAMSPVGGVGINLAVQDAVAAANILAEPLKKGLFALEVLPRCSAAAMADAADAGRADLRADASSAMCSPCTTQPRAPFVVTLLNRFPVVPPLSGAAHRHGLPARARARSG